MGGCITAVAGSTPESVASAFGADLDTTLPFTSTEEASDTDLVAVVPSDPGSVVVVEASGDEGTRSGVLKRASTGGKAASVFWNVEDLVVFACARRGKMVCVFEVGDDDLDDVPKSLHGLARHAFSDETDLVAVGAAMVAKFTGVAVDEHHLSNVQNGHPITSRVVDLHYPRDELITFNMPRADLVSAVQDASQQACRRVTTLATVTAIVHAKLDGDPRVRRVIDQLEAGSVPALSSEVERLVRECEVGFDRASTRLALDGGATEELDARYWAVRGWASRALPYACHQDAVTSALGTLTCARYALGYLPTAFVDEVLLTLSGNTEGSG